MANLRAALIPLLLVTCLAAPAHAATESEHQIWLGAFLHARPSRSSGFLGWLDIQDRRRSGSSLFILRPALGYQITERLALYAGYAWIPRFEDEGPNSQEHRIWQQALWNVPMPTGWAFSLRPRLEQRFAEGGDEIGHRVRLLARSAVTPWEALPALLVAWDEVFYQLNDAPGQRSGFDQNRLFVGVGAPAWSGVRVEVGYLNVFLDRAPNNQMDHNVAVNLFYNY